MSENRRTILTNLKTLLSNVTGVTTVKRSYMPVDILNYKEADLPLVNLIEPPEEAWQETTSQHAVQLLDIDLKIHFVSWAEDPSATYETLTKNIRDAIGADFELGGAASACWVVEVSKIDGQMPVYNYGMVLRCKYWLNQKTT